MIRSVLSLLLLASAAHPQDDGPKFDLSKHYWGKWKPGTYVMYHVLWKVNDEETEYTLSRRLESVDKDAIVISERHYDAADGSELGRERWTMPHPKFSGKETTTLLGKETAVNVWEWDGKGERNTVHFKMFMTADGTLIRWSWVLGDDGPQAMCQDDYLAASDDEREIGGKKYRCWRMEGKYGPKSNPGRIKEWGSMDVPGGTVRMEAESPNPESKVGYTYQTLEFGVSDLSKELPAPRPRRADLKLQVGMSGPEALSSLRESGARTFPCGYAIGESPARPRPFRATRYLTLRNGLTLRVGLDKKPWIEAARGNAPWPEHFANGVACRTCGSKEGKPCGGGGERAPHRVRVDDARKAGLPKDDPGMKLEVESIAFCNSTALLCNKMETWIPTESVELRGSRLVLGAITPVLHKGMSREQADALMEKAGAKAGETPAGLPKPGVWTLYPLAGDMRALLNLVPREGGAEELGTLVLELPEKDGERTRLECEAVDLSAPLGERLGRSIPRDWQWNPDDPKKLQDLKRNGHRR